jgi:hypothetical protein
MALDFGQAVIGTVPTLITIVPPGPFAMTLVAGGTAVAIGTGTTMTFSTGAVINATSSVSYAGFPESAGTALYGVSSSGTAATISFHLSTDH